MPEIYYWAPSIKDQQVGHVSMKLSDGTYLSHWPAEEKKKFGTVRGGSNTFDDDVKIEGRRPDETLHLPSGMLNEDDIRGWWEKYEGDYNILGNNCAQVTHQALIVGGINRYNFSRLTKGPQPHGVPDRVTDNILTPADLMKFARECRDAYEGRSGNIVTDIFKSFF